jgi:hypothetical protein
VGRSSAYGRLSIAQKQRRALDEMREPSVACPRCETQTSATELVEHLKRCTGPREPHPRSRWVTWGEALELGVPRVTMNRWIGRGLIRTRTVPVPQRQYLLRDLVRRMAERSARRR